MAINETLSEISPAIMEYQYKNLKSLTPYSQNFDSRDQLDSGLRFGDLYVIIYLVKLLEQKDYKWITVAMGFQRAKLNPNWHEL